MPIDLVWLRKDQGGDPDFWRKNQAERFCDPGLVDQAIELDDECRRMETALRDMRRDFNAANKAVGAKKKAKEDATAELAEAARLKSAIPETTAKLAELKALRTSVVGKIANIRDPTVPVFKDEEKNEEVFVWGDRRTGDDIRPHHDLLYMIGGFEPERAVRIAGHRAYFLTGPGVELNLALIAYGTAFLRERGYTLVQPPYFMKADVMGGVAQLSEFDEALYSVTGDGDGKKYLIATSEQPLCGFHKDESLRKKDLPKRYAGFSTCFRKEAGSGGRDETGIFRVHQFEKVEQFVVCDPEKSAEMQDEMIGAAQEFYKSLGLPFHVVNMVSGELNNAASKKLDLEAWFPAQGTYRELVSCSNCTDYQSRAMNIGLANQERTFCHLLNATLVATTRAICCILENYQTPEGITVPPVLVPFMGGKTFIEFVRKPLVVKDTAPKGGKASAKGGAKPAGGAKAAAAPKGGAKPAGGAAPAKGKTADKPAAGAGAPAAKPAQAPALPAASRRLLGSDCRPPVVKAPAAESKAAASLEALDAVLLHQSYVTGFTATQADVDTLAAHGAALETTTLPNVRRWFTHMQTFSAEERAALPKA